MAVKRRQPAQPPTAVPKLRLPLESAERQMDERIAKGRQLLPTSHAIRTMADLTKLQQDLQTWIDYNASWIERNISSSLAAEYSSSIGVAGGDLPLPKEVEFYQQDVEMYVRRLQSIRERLPLWADGEAKSSQVDSADAEGPIFVVHGRDEGKAQFVARVLERGTGRDVTILREQPNEGRTLIEKFEHHAERASFAVVVLTGDDEGGLAGTGVRQPRGRQNVVFELGFFFGLLGRGRVVVLMQPGVEQPSDVHGLVYIELDATGAWKHELARELDAAGITVRRERMP